MSKAIERLAKARLEERVARARWFAALEEVQDRTTPSHIATEILDGIKDGASALTDRAVDTAKKRPGLVAAIGSGLLLFFLRKPLSKLVRFFFAKRNETSRAARPLANHTPKLSDEEPMPDLAPRPTMTEEK